MPHSLDPIFRPRSVAVIGASTAPKALGRQILENILNYRFCGPVYPVNPKTSELLGLRCFPSVQAIPDAVDLAVVVVPRPAVPGVIAECGTKGVRGVIVITAGFRETGEEGRQLEEAVAAEAARYGMRLVGPNCMGVINTDPHVRLNATFAPTMPLAGNVAFLSQSGALGVAILSIAEERNLGLSSFASLGNKADVADDDVLAYWADDPATSVVLMYLESFSHPAEFARVARQISRKKPLLVVKSGKTQAGARAAISHTGALAATSDLALDAFLAHCGVQRVGTVEELFDLGLAFARNPLPPGPRVAIISNAGGPAILATDAVIGHGLEMARLSEATLAALRPRMPEHASVSNPLDMLPDADAPLYGFALERILADPGVDMALVIFVPPLMVDPVEVIGALETARRTAAKPVVGVLMAPEESRALLHETFPDHLALCQFPESAARALAGLERQRRWCARGPGQEPKLQVHRAAVEQILEQAQREGRCELHLHECFQVLEAYGIPVARYALVRSAEAAEEAARSLGFPVAMKLPWAGIAHKTEARALALNIRSTDQAFHTYHGLTHGGALGDTVLVQEMLSGRETILGMLRDPNLGPLVLFGLGGLFVETLRDVAFRPVPLTDLDAQELIAAIRGYPILAGVRGQKPVAFASLEEAILRLSRLVQDFDVLEEMDINPFFASERPEECRAADARIRLRPKP
ncbi:MAG: acetate--CoA ligase family protein [Acidobacteriia bacterium]|nr:acetate--CoA ligase family protein [Terriglobia bacterium]